MSVSTQRWPGSVDVQTPPQRSRIVAVPDPDSDVLLTIAFGLFILDIFLTMSRLLEVVFLAGLGSVPYLTVTIHVATFALVMVTGGGRRAATSRVGIYLGLFTGWMAVCSLLSIWKGGSADLMMRHWSVALIAFINCGAVVTLRQCRRISAALAGGTLLIAAASYALGTLKEQRLALVDGTLGNANDLAMLLLIGVPFFLVPVFSGRGSKARMAVALVFGVAVLVAIARAGSRSGFLSVLAILAVLFWTRPLGGKLKLGLTVVALVCVFFATVPQAVLSRYLTTFSDPETRSDLEGEAYGSKVARQRLLEQSLKLTLEHPVFGVGPGVFMVGEANAAKAEGRPAMWRVSHNSLTQVSSETGIPGLLLYLAALWCTLRNVFWFRANSRIDPTGTASAIGLALLLSLTGLCINLIFSSNAYGPYLTTLMGLSVVFRNSLQREIDWRSQALMAPAPQRTAPSEMPGSVSVSAKPSYRFLGRPRRLGT